MAERVGSVIRHGGDMSAARRSFPFAPEPFLDLSTGINPVPYPYDPPPQQAYTLLPEADSLWQLQVAAARAYGVSDPECVVAAPGTQLLISLLPRLMPQAAVAVLGPTYAEHAEAWRDSGSVVHRVESLDEGAEQGAAVLCQPNNPDGQRHPPDALLHLAARLRLLVVDEAFADFEPGFSVASAVAQAPGLVVLRSFGKTYGLAGLRLGFALMAPGPAATLRRALGPWAVSGPAIAIGRQALADQAWLHRSAERLRGDVAWLDAQLHQAGCRVIGGTLLFRLVRTADSARLAERLGQAGVIVRTFSDHPELIRFGIPAPGAQGRLEDALHI